MRKPFKKAIIQKIQAEVEAKKPSLPILSTLVFFNWGFLHAYRHIRSNCKSFPQGKLSQTGHCVHRHGKLTPRNSASWQLLSQAATLEKHQWHVCHYTQAKRGATERTPSTSAICGQGTLLQWSKEHRLSSAVPSCKAGPDLPLLS